MTMSELDAAIRDEMQLHRELELESLAVSMGATRYHKERALPWRDRAAQKKAEADTHPGKALIDRVLDDYEAGIKTAIKRVQDGHGGGHRPTLAVKYLKHFDPSLTAFAAARRIINGAAVQEGLTSLAIGIANLLEDHHVFETFRTGEETRPVYRTLKQRMDRKTAHEGHRRRAFRAVARDLGVTGLEWTKADKVHVGTALINWFVESTGVVEFIEVKRRGKSKKLVRFADGAKKFLDALHDRHALLAPVLLPMVVPPKDWTSPLSGGYINRQLLRTSLVDTRRGTIDELFNVQMPEVYASLNVIQRTPWRVNKAVLGVADEVKRRGMTLGKAFPGEDEELPERPSDIPTDVGLKDLPEEQASRLRDWITRKGKAHERNVLRSGRRVVTAQQLWVAQEFAPEDRIYFPHNLDFRGRVYPIPPVLNPQSDDFGRAMLEYADGKPLGENGGYWLAVHLANSFGFDKASFDERVAWTQAHTVEILDCAMRPLDGEMLWTQADKPWTFLAGCFEWAGMMVQGTDYVSHLPVNMDATCSGLQHFSALLRDERGGAAVNLIPAAERRDIYGEVAARVAAEIERSTDPEAAQWRGHVGRPVVKQPTMTYAYSATPNGMRDQIITAIEDNGLPIDEEFRAAHYLAPKVRAAISETVVAAAGAMGWLQEVAALFAKANLPIRWVTPAGFVVIQDCRLQRRVRVKVNVGGKYAQLDVLEDTDKQDAGDSRSAVSPNVIHSLDACHLMRTAIALEDNGVTYLSMIHDSFGVHACDVDLLHKVLRAEFIRLYSFDHLAALRQEFADQLPPELAAEIPPVPAYGKLDLEAIRESDFFFS